MVNKSEARMSKLKALQWLRFNQRCGFIATEVGLYSADVLGCTLTKMIEVEVNVGFEDFKNDFKKHKHFSYLCRDLGCDQWVPNIFYFSVPSSIIEECRKHLVKLEAEWEGAREYSRYGLINSDEWRVIKRAKKLHDKLPSDRVKQTILMRMGSELVRFHEDLL